MPRARSSNSKAATPVTAVRWYLSGDEECPHCGLLYAYELEFRCPDCDSPTCPQCKSQHAEDRFVCPDCVVVTLKDAGDGG